LKNVDIRVNHRLKSNHPPSNHTSNVILANWVAKMPLKFHVEDKKKPKDFFCELAQLFLHKFDLPQRLVGYTKRLNRPDDASSEIIVAALHL